MKRIGILVISFISICWNKCFGFKALKPFSSLKNHHAFLGSRNRNQIPTNQIKSKLFFANIGVDDNIVAHYLYLAPSFLSTFSKLILTSGVVTDVGINPSPNVADDFLFQVQDSTVVTFFSSLSSRLIGGLIGNILAGVAFKLILDKITPQKDSATSVHGTFSPTSSSSLQDSRWDKSNKVLSSIPPSAWVKLLACIAIDLVSDSSFLLPGVGEAEDIAWAPISAFLLKNLFDSNTVGAIEFTKEILPFTDIIPLATSVWFLENVFSETPLAKSLGVGQEKKVEKNKDD